MLFSRIHPYWLSTYLRLISKPCCVLPLGSLMRRLGKHWMSLIQIHPDIPVTTTRLGRRCKSVNQKGTLSFFYILSGKIECNCLVWVDHPVWVQSHIHVRSVIYSRHFRWFKARTNNTILGLYVCSPTNFVINVLDLFRAVVLGVACDDFLVLDKKLVAVAFARRL